MIPWEEIDRAEVPGGSGEVVLRRRGMEFSIRTATTELMNSRRHGSEDALAELTCSRINRKIGQRVLVGGLGMGFTLATALRYLEHDARIIVAELIPAVVRWNQEHLGLLAGKPLDDSRVTIQQEDVAETIIRDASSFDAIILDVDNGPDGLTREENDRLYGVRGLNNVFRALRQGGILAVWSSGADQQFTRRLKQCKFQTETVSVRAHKPGKGARHTIWLATKL